MAKLNRRSEKAEFWRLVIKRQRKSGLSIRAFCRQENLSEPLFFAWRKRIEGPGHTAVNAEERRTKQGAAPSSSLLPVELSDKPKSGTGGSVLEIMTPGGWTLRFGECLPSKRLSDLLSTILEAERRSAAC
jgi:hypothetical protein